MDWSNCYSHAIPYNNVPRLAVAFRSPSEGQRRSFVQGSYQGSQEPFVGNGGVDEAF